MSKSTFDSVNKIWRGPAIPPQFNPDQCVGYLILKNLAETPDAVALIVADTGVSVTCKEIHDRSIKFAKFIQKLEIKSGSRVGIIAANTEHIAPIVFGCFVLGFPINPLSPIMNELDIVQMYSKTQPKMIFCDAENLKVVQNAVNEMKSDAKILTVMEKVDGYDCVSDILKEMEMESVDDFECPLLDPNSTAVILCSSGSTGFMKGICKSHREIIHDFSPSFKQNGTNQIRLFQTSNIFWFSGFYFLIIGALYKCIRVITKIPVEPNLIVNIINKYEVNICMLPPFMVAKILQIQDLKPLESVTQMIVAGSQISKSLIGNLAKFIPNGATCAAYGCTEQNFVTISDGSVKNENCGTAFNNMEIKIVDEQLNSLAANQQGEIWTKKPIQFLEYFGYPSEKKDSFHGEWFKTGDIGYFDENEHLFVIDRKKDMLKYENYQITPSEIEAVINEIPGIISSNVVGIYDESEGNDIIYAFVVIDNASNLTENSILEYVNGKVSNPKKIRGGVHILETFPLTFSGKISKIKLAEIARGYNN